MTKDPNSFDGMQAKREVQTRIYDEIRGRSRSEQVHFFRTEATRGDIGAWWQQVRSRKQADTSLEIE
jgi:hypothetical protein